MKCEPYNGVRLCFATAPSVQEAMRVATDLLGIHHVTAIARDPQANADFYAGVLGLRLVKRTVNFDDPNTYHLYYGDELGRPGTLLTFFPAPGAPRGRRGTGQAVAVALSVPAGSLPYWQERLARYGAHPNGPEVRFGQPVLAFTDPDGLALELVAHGDPPVSQPWAGGPVPPEHGIGGVHSVTLASADPPATARLLTAMGFREVAREGERVRYAVAGGGPGALVDVLHPPGLPRGVVAAGTVHHVAWCTPSAEDQQAWRRRLDLLGITVTPVQDRKYFQSIYFREPGGVLFEIATDPPGFAVDEAPATLGTRLQLPAWLEPHRARIEAALPPLAPPRPREVGPLDFVHRYEPPARPGAPTLLLLHGTGGDEHDLIPLGRELLPGAGLLSPRGKVLEHGMPRFFRRLAPGVFDLDDLRQRTTELAAFLAGAARHYGFDPGQVVAAGYSNGANMAASLLLLRPGSLAGAVLFRPMVPLVPDPIPRLEGVPVFVAAGRRDTVVPPAEAERLAHLLRQAGAAVTLHWQEGGHELRREEVQAAAAWLREAVPGAAG